MADPISAGALLGATALSGSFGLGTGFLSNATSYGTNKKLMKMQAALNYHYAKKSAKNSPSWNREGLETAGYNPMLAVQNATSGSNSNWSGLNSSENPELADAFSSGISNVMNYQRLKNETAQTDSIVNLQNQQAKTEEDKRINLQFDSLMKDAQKHLTDKESSWYDKKANAEIYKQTQEAELARAQAGIQAYNAETARISAKAQKDSVAIQETGNPFRMFSKKAGEHLDSFVKDHPLWSNNPYVRFLHKTFN